jgi:hypothetical protein
MMVMILTEITYAFQGQHANENLRDEHAAQDDFQRDKDF